MSRPIDVEKAVEIIEAKQKELCPVGRCGRNYVYGSDREKYDAWEEIIDALENLPTLTPQNEALTMKFRNKETAEVLDDISKVADRYCMNHDCFWQRCPMKDATKGESCGRWTKDHPHEAAALMEYEVIPESGDDTSPLDTVAEAFNQIGKEANMDNPCLKCETGWGTISVDGCKSCRDTCEKLKQYEKANMNKPRICEVLGVEAGERFRPKHLCNGFLSIKENGTIEFDGDPSVKDISNLILWLVYHPEDIVRIGNDKPRFTQQDIDDAKMIRAVFGENGIVKRYGKATTEPYGALVFNDIYINENMLPGVKEGQEYSLNEIIKSES